MGNDWGYTLVRSLGKKKEARAVVRKGGGTGEITVGRQKKRAGVVQDGGGLHAVRKKRPDMVRGSPNFRNRARTVPARVTLHRSCARVERTSKRMRRS